MPVTPTKHIIRKVAAVTLGCKVNMYDTEAMLKLFVDKGYQITDFDDPADVYIINTCTVTNLSDKKSRQMIRRARKRNDKAVIVAAGCYAQTSPEEVSAIKEIDIVTGTAERGRVVELVEGYILDRLKPEEVKTLISVPDLNENIYYENLEINSNADKTRAYIKIQDGCNQFCSYCIIPYARGAIRSRALPEIMREAGRLVENGYRELVLAGIHVASYGKDLGSGIELLDLLYHMHELDGVERIRLSSLDPRYISDKFVDSLKDLPRLCPHFHLSLQSGCNKILAAMNRKYTKEEYAGIILRITDALPDAAITTDIIVGFPGETDEDFNESYEFISGLKLARLHVFPYSPKKGTPAAEFNGQVGNTDKHLRAEKMIMLGNKMSMEFYGGYVGRSLPVLFESCVGGNIYEGHTGNYMTVRCESDNNICNQILKVRVLYVDNNIAYGAKMY